MQEIVIGKIGRFEFLAAGNEFRRADRKHIHIGQLYRFHVFPVAGPVSDPELRLVGMEVHKPVFGIDGKLDIGMEFVESPEAGHEPARCDRRLDRDFECPGSPSRHDVSCRLREAVEQGSKLAAVARACLSKLHSAPRAVEQLHAEPLFEVPQMPADGGMRDEQLLRRQRKAFVSGGGLEGAKGIQGW